jgi:ferredoxin-NADP reductase
MATLGVSSASRRINVDAAPEPNVWQEAVIEGIFPETPTVRRCLLRPHRWNPFTAGQYLEIRLTSTDGYQAQRSYSVASAPEAEGAYEIIVERLKDGEVSPYFHDVAETGDLIEIRGPFGGHFVWRASDGGPVLLIGGGSGVAPLMSMVRHRSKRGRDVRVILLFAVRTWEDVIFRDELIARDEVEGNFDMLLSLSRDTPRRPQDAGRRIDGPLLRSALERVGSNPKLTLVCGSNAFVETVTSHLVDLRLPPETIRTERFGG